MDLNLTHLENCIQTAIRFNCPREQVDTFFKSNHIPLPWQWEFHSVARQADYDNGPVDIGLGGARGPGKSHSVLAQSGLDDCQRVPGLKGLFLRQTGLAAQESFDDLIDKVIKGRAVYKKSGSAIRFDNESKIVLGGFKDNKDIDKYIGIEYDFIIVEELNQITEEKYTKLRGSLRTSKPNWRPRMYTSFNPGGIGHKWVRERYIIPHRKGEEKETRFIGSTYKENPYLNKEYIEYLEGLTGELGRAWREGDWDLFAGQVFDEFRYDRHVLPKPVMPSKNFQHFLSMDWGYSEKSAFAGYAHALLKQKTEDGQNFNRVITYKEWYGNKKYPEEWAELIYNQLKDTNFYKGYTDPAMFNTGTDGSVPISKLMMNKWHKLSNKNWCNLERGNNNRIARVATVHNWLSIAPDGMPYWVITPNCVNLIETLPLLIYDENRVDDVDTDGPDHAYDSVGYFLMMVKFIAVRTGATRGVQKLKRIQAFNRQGEGIAIDLDKFKQTPKQTKRYFA